MKAIAIDNHGSVLVPVRAASRQPLRSSPIFPAGVSLAKRWRELLTSDLCDPLARAADL